MKRLAAFALLLLPACDDVGHAVADQGQVCIDRNQVIDFKQTGRLHLKVELPCEEACIDLADAHCEATIEGPDIVLESQFLWSVPPTQDCYTRCQDMTAECIVPSTHPGRYTLVHGADQYTLDLPSNPLLDCLDPDTL